MARQAIWYLEDLLDIYGQKCVEEFLDMIIIVKNPSNETIRNWLLKYKIIKPTTKIIYKNIYKSGYNPNQIRVEIHDGRGERIISLTIFADTLHEILQESIA